MYDVFIIIVLQSVLVLLNHSKFKVLTFEMTIKEWNAGWNKEQTSLKVGANQFNISSNITFLPCWMKCWNDLRSYKIYKVSKKKKKIMLGDVGWILFQNRISFNMFRRKSMSFPCWNGLVGCFIQHSYISADLERLHVRIAIRIS